ncbi:hypothetical protein [Bradyrhizobium sp. RDT46]|uniref:hypothetical protein n=1 Tax=Bradyrhizobium sp. RDT46 TaxID=3341829 RepID=UPI0035C6D736
MTGRDLYNKLYKQNGVRRKSPRKLNINVSDLHRLGGSVSVLTYSHRCDGTPQHCVYYVSSGGALTFLSLPIVVEDHAWAAARMLAEIFNATEAAQ